jgi:hypothetical protein
MRRRLISTAIVLAMAGCREDGQSPQQQIAQDGLQREKEQRIQAEAAREEARAGKERWQGFTAVACIGAIILLITGTILGSRTKQDSERDE